MKVSEILKVKGDALYTVTPETLLVNAVRVMAEKDIGSLLVMENGRLSGMLTFREVLKAICTHHGVLGYSMVRQYMDNIPPIIDPDTDVNKVRSIMLQGHTRYLPVMGENDTLLGVISFYDVAKAVLEAQGFENKMLKAYIRDWPVATNGEDDEI